MFMSSINFYYKYSKLIFLANLLQFDNGFIEYFFLNLIITRLMSFFHIKIVLVLKIKFLIA